MKRQTSALSLLEVLVVALIVAALMAILFPFFAKAQQASKTTAILANAKQLTLALLMYADDTNDRLPSACFNEAYTGPHAIGAASSAVPLSQELLPDHLMPYLKNAAIFEDPTQPDRRALYYAPRQKYVASGAFNYMCGHGPADHPLLKIIELAGTPELQKEVEDGGVFVCARTLHSINELQLAAGIFRDSFAIEPTEDPQWEPTFLPLALGGRGGQGLTVIGYCDGHAKSSRGSFQKVMTALGLAVRG
jgi:type II secretory pathway pseudopilin PulG